MKENKDGWRKIETSVFKFVNEGDMIEGILLKVEPSTLKDATNKVYTLETDNGNNVVFGTSVMDTLMANVRIGQIVRIMYTGEVQNKKKGLSPIKQFEVFVK